LGLTDGQRFYAPRLEPAGNVNYRLFKRHRRPAP
jgi:hypothetical protein